MIWLIRVLWIRENPLTRWLQQTLLYLEESFQYKKKVTLLQIGPAVRPLMRWWWIIVLSSIGAAIAAYSVSTSKVNIYEATATVLIENGGGSGQTSLGDIQVSRELGKTYVHLVRTSALLERVSERPEINRTPVELRAQLKATTISGTQIMAISVRDQIPETAAAIANAIANAFVIQQQDRQLLEVVRLQGALRQYGLADSTSLIAAQFAAVDSISVLEPAPSPESPVTPKPMRDAALGAVLGFAIGSLLAASLQLMDLRIRSQEELEAIIGGPVLGALPKFSFSSDAAKTVQRDLQSMQEDFRFNESIRMIAINLKYQISEIDNDSPSVITITSSQEGEGKTSVASSMSIALAQLGARVVLVDMDFRKPRVHQIFQLQNTNGVTSLLAMRSNVKEVLNETQYEGVSVITSGILPPDPIQLFRSKRMMALLEELKSQFDFVILDSAPLLAVADTAAILLQSQNTILVVDQTQSNRRAIGQSVREIQDSKTTSLFGLLNRVGNRDGDLDGYGYGPAYGYYGPNLNRKNRNS